MLRRLFLLLLICSALAGLCSWIVSREMADTWAVTQSPTPEALLEARGLLWSMRIGAPVVAFVLWRCLRHWSRTERRLHATAREFLAATTPQSGNTGPAVLRRLALRTFILAWLLLAAVHWWEGGRRGLHEWPVYRWTSGDRVLPNMSESNRDVIRFLQETTPDNARILGVSDQTLFFLAYYLWPREVLHHRHPDSEFVVPQPGQARQLAAYRLSDLTAEQLSQIRPDYVLEYFEGPEYVEPDRVLDDLLWVSFTRRLHGDPSHRPTYNVRLRRMADVRSGQ